MPDPRIHMIVSHRPNPNRTTVASVAVAAFASQEFSLARSFTKQDNITGAIAARLKCLGDVSTEHSVIPKTFLAIGVATYTSLPVFCVSSTGDVVGFAVLWCSVIGPELGQVTTGVTWAAEAREYRSCQWSSILAYMDRSPGYQLLGAGRCANLNELVMKIFFLGKRKEEKLFKQVVRRAASRTCWTAGNSIAIKMPMIAMTTSSSTSVKAGRKELERISIPFC